MSNIYIQEPPTKGKVLLETTVGDIDIELWSKEAPRASRNFIQLCMENYYENTIFHRVVPGFIVQGGDPTGTGMGGESVYGKPFRDEFHSRLKFVRRGLVAMANAGRDDNGSQFFFTLAPAPELQNKHTIFGKVQGDTLYNMLKLAEGLIENEHPVYPQKILRTKVLLNPFDDIQPRIVPQRDGELEDGKSSKKKKKKGTKDFKLLSFGEEAEEDEEEMNFVSAKYSGKSKSAHDLTNDPRLSSNPAVVQNLVDEDDGDRKKIRDRLDENDKFVELKRTELLDDVRKKLKRNNENQTSVKENDEMKRATSDNKKKKDEDNTPSVVVDYRNAQEYFKNKQKDIPKRKKAAREEMTMALLAKFTDKLQKAKDECGDGSQPLVDDEEEEEGEVDDRWMLHTLKFDKDDNVLAKDANTKEDDWYDIYDPRNDMNKRRREGDKNSGGRGGAREKDKRPSSSYKSRHDWDKRKRVS